VIELERHCLGSVIPSFAIDKLKHLLILRISLYNSKVLKLLDYDRVDMGYRF